METNGTIESRIKIWTAGRSPNTTVTYTYYIRDFERIAQETFNKSFFDVDDEELLQILAIKSDTLAPASLHTRTAMLRAFFAYAYKKGWSKTNPAKDLRLPKYENTLTDRILTHEQVVKLMDAADCRRDRIVIKTLYYSALRVSELCHLKKQDLSHKDGIWSLRVFGKGQRTDYVRIPDDLGKELAAWCKEKASDHFVFTPLARVNAKCHRRLVYRIVMKTGGYIGVKATPHYLRHTHATVALSKGASLPLVQKSLRHRNVETTMKYIHIKPEEGSSMLLPSCEK